MTLRNWCELTCVVFEHSPASKKIFDPPWPPWNDWGEASSSNINHWFMCLIAYVSEIMWLHLFQTVWCSNKCPWELRVWLSNRIFQHPWFLFVLRGMITQAMSQLGPGFNSMIDMAEPWLLALRSLKDMKVRPNTRRFGSMFCWKPWDKTHPKWSTWGRHVWNSLNSPNETLRSRILILE